MSLGIVPPMTVSAATKPETAPNFDCASYESETGENRGLCPVSGGGALRLRGPERFGQSEILREMVHADHLVAQLSRALEQSLLFCADDARGERGMRELLGGLAAYRAGFLGRADLGLDRFGSDRSFERGFEAPERFALRFRQVHSRAEPVAHRRPRDEQSRDFVPARVAGGREVPAER